MFFFNVVGTLIVISKDTSKNLFDAINLKERVLETLDEGGEMWGEDIYKGHL